LVFGSFLTMLVSCSEYQRVMKGKDYDAKFNLAVKYFNKKNYYKAFPLFEELMTIYRGTTQAEKVYYYYAYCNYHSGDYESAAYDFDNFVRTFPASPFAEECAYMHAYCYYQDSPVYSLDQTSTVKAIEKLQLFVDRYPGSSRVEKCNEIIDALRYKLETKEFENAKLYYGTTQYKAAVTAFRNMISDYPGTRYTEEALYLIFKSQSLYAENSVEDKKQERMEQALKYCDDLIAAFPESKYKKQALSLRDDIQKQLARKFPAAVSQNLN
jgi:outer membrane protein assembly factor BamD